MVATRREVGDVRRLDVQLHAHDAQAIERVPAHQFNRASCIPSTPIRREDPVRQLGVLAVVRTDFEYAAAHQPSRASLSDRESPSGSARFPLLLPVSDLVCDVSPRERAWETRSAHVAVILTGPQCVDVGVGEAIHQHDTIGKQQRVRGLSHDDPLRDDSGTRTFRSRVGQRWIGLANISAPKAGHAGPNWVARPWSRCHRWPLRGRPAERASRRLAGGGWPGRDRRVRSGRRSPLSTRPSTA